MIRPYPLPWKSCRHESPSLRGVHRIRRGHVDHRRIRAQALKSWSSRDPSGISLRMYALFTLGVGLWLDYGLFIGSWPVILANGLTLGLAGLVLGVKIRHSLYK
jgi:MtN3 and saliva related transmembrane protein